MTETPRYDVVIIACDDESTLPACLNAVRAMEPGPSRLLLVDNASSDRSAAIASEFDAEVLQQTENTGFAGGMNRGLAASDAPWVLALNPDCAPSPDFAGALFSAVSACGGARSVGAATGLLMRADGDDLRPTATVDAAGMVVTPSGRHFDRGAGKALAEAPLDPAWVFGGTGAATLYRREALDDATYQDGQVFPESFFCYREDADLAWRLQHRGWRCLYVPAARAFHRRGFQPEAGRRGHEWINRHSVRNRFLLRLHCADGGWLLRCLPDWLLRDFLVVAACLTIERSSAGALIEAWRLRRDALVRRRWVMSRRRVPSRQVSRWFRRPRGWVDLIDR